MAVLESGEDRRRGGLEKHVQTILTMGVAALLAWQLTAVEEMRIQLATLAGRVEALAARVDEASSDRYRAAEAQRDFALRDQVIHRLEMRVARLEDNLEHHAKPPREAR